MRSELLASYLGHDVLQIGLQCQKYTKNRPQKETQS
jgi:hypothetical protein